MSSYDNRGVELGYLERMLGAPPGPARLKAAAEMTEEDWFQLKLARAEEEAAREANGGNFKAWVDCVRGIRIEFNGTPSRALTSGEIAEFQARYAEDPTSDNMWRILGEMTQVGAMDGEAVFEEMMQFYRSERLGMESGRYASPLDVEAILSRLDSVLEQIGRDRAADACAKQAESKRYQELKEMIQLIAGRL